MTAISYGYKDEPTPTPGQAVTGHVVGVRGTVVEVEFGHDLPTRRGAPLPDQWGPADHCRGACPSRSLNGAGDRDRFDARAALWQPDEALAVIGLAPASHVPYAVSACFDGVGTFTPVCMRVWPSPPVRQSSPIRPSVYVSRAHLITVALREFLYIVLFQILLDALAAEHSTRLVATGSAAEWLKTRIAETRRQLTTSRRETSTQELLDIVSGARRPRRSLGEDTALADRLPSS